ncbi:MAG: nucleotide exchange factor GrpE [Holosporaceae bacterium]|jgi:molecular chaperone GrpE|nr:nucleotide exchange factor GrpE [Holosporaceae bacterium]
MNEENNQVNENPEAEVEAISPEEQIKKLEEEVGFLKNNLLRKAAESENLRKRLEKEKEETVKYSNTKFARDLLSVVDNFERVMENSASISEQIETNADLKALLEGILLCRKEIISIFKKHGISKTEVNEGDAFNPEIHQAMCELECSDQEAGSIIKIFQTGYTYNDRLLRPAMVSVARQP